MSIQTAVTDTLQVDLGSGDDSFHFQPGNQDLPFLLNVNGGDGDNLIDLALGTASVFASTVTLKGGKGNDTIHLSVTKLLLGFRGSRLLVSTEGEEGADRLFADVHNSGLLNTFASPFVLSLSGGDSADRIGATVPGEGLAVRVHGDGGNDRFRLVSRPDSSGGVPDAAVKGGPGKDVCHTTGKVRVSGCEA